MSDTSGTTSIKIDSQAQITCWTADEMKILREILNSNDAMIVALRERIATLEAEQWTPVASGGFQERMNRGPDKEPYALGFHIEGRMLIMKDSNGQHMTVLLRPGYAVCRRTGSEGEVTNGE